MEGKSKYIAAAVVIIILAAAASFVMFNDDKDDADNSIKFLIQDNEGVYFWIQGEGETAIDAFKNAIGQDAYKDAAKFAPSSKDGVDYGILSLYGLEMSEDATGKWSWWTQYIWSGTAWVTSEKMMDKYGADECNNYIATVYGDGSVMPAATPADAKVWDGSKDGVLFTIKSVSGMEFYANGTGKTIYDAFKNVTQAYKINFEPSVKDQVETGINTLFSNSMDSGVTDDGKSYYDYWAQYYRNAGEDWGYGQGYMNTIDSSTYSECKVVYEHSVF